MVISDNRNITEHQTTDENHVARTVADIRNDFPILSRQVHGKPLVYLDSAASSQKPVVSSSL